MKDNCKDTCYIAFDNQFRFDYPNDYFDGDKRDM